MSLVRRAHLPGNYELYDPSSNVLGPAICKGCWEEAGTQTTGSLHTVWVTVQGSKMVWWLCRGHMDAMMTNPAGMKFLKSEDVLVRSPRI